MTRTLVADLPPMGAVDFTRFEKEGGVWGQQRAIRRQQVRTACVTSLASSVFGAVFVKSVRRNTWYVVVGTFPLFAVSGFAAGNAIGTLLFPSVANNKETTMMRRVWWAKECSKHWDMSQVRAETWKAQYPNVAMPK